MSIAKPILAIKVNTHREFLNLKETFQRNSMLIYWLNSDLNCGHMVIYEHATDPLDVWYNASFVSDDSNIDLYDIKILSISHFYDVYEINDYSIINVIKNYSLSVDDKKGEEKMEIIVYTNAGATYKFENVSNFQYTTNGFKFEYVGASTSVKRTIEFNNTSTAGFAKS